MTPLALFVACTLALGSTAAHASDETALDPAALAEAYFDESERFDALLTYENRRGPARMVFTVARRIRDGLAELLFDVREPVAFREVALLERQRRGKSDDLFAYFGNLGTPSDRRVRRLAASDLKREAAFGVFAIGDFRPSALGELSYEAAEDTVVANTPARAVIARPTHAALGFDRLELYFARDTGLLLESRYFRREREFRRISIAPDAWEVHDGRRLPMRRTARAWADDGVTELILRNVIATPDLPDELFSHKNLATQHFPEF